ncbi:MAG: hypothetical protein D6675_16345 [Gemmatimonadetes bacterium]|nr:MAG: hypothetical protein D6675_16345 [Gemmatimonadota bacterium]
MITTAEIYQKLKKGMDEPLARTLAKIMGQFYVELEGIITTTGEIDPTPAGNDKVNEIFLELNQVMDENATQELATTLVQVYNELKQMIITRKMY